MAGIVLVFGGSKNMKLGEMEGDLGVCPDFGPGEVSNNFGMSSEMCMAQI